MILLALCLAQDVVLEEERSAPLRTEKPRFLAATARGGHLLVGEASRVLVLDGASLEVVDAVDIEATTAGSDLQERHLYFAGASLLRLEARFRKLSLSVPLPEASFEKELAGGLQPLQAVLRPDGGVYYRGSDDRLLLATWEGESLSVQEFARPRRYRYSGSVRRVIGAGEGAVFVTDGSLDHGGVALPERGIFSLALAYGTLGAGTAEARALFVGRDGEYFYDSTNWKLQWQREGQETTATAFDARNGWAFAASPAGLRAIRIADPERVVRFEPLKELGLLAVDGLGRRLFALQGGTVRSWKIRTRPS